MIIRCSDCAAPATCTVLELYHAGFQIIGWWPVCDKHAGTYTPHVHEEYPRPILTILSIIAKNDHTAIKEIEEEYRHMWD